MPDEKQDATEIHSIIAAFQPGSVAAESDIEEREPCSVCLQPYRPVVKHLVYALDDWLDCDFCKVGSEFAVTPKLADAVTAEGMQGFRLRPMTVQRSAFMDEIDPDNDIALPDLVHLAVEAETDGPSAWWQREPEPCTRCHRPLWRGGEEAGKALASTRRKPKGPPREVSRSSWKGADIFWMSDPGPPLVSDRLRVLLERYKTPELILAPALLV